MSVMEILLVVAGVAGGAVILLALCFLAVAIWIGILEETKWSPGEPLYHLMDKIIDYTRRIVRRFKRRGNGDAA